MTVPPRSCQTTEEDSPKSLVWPSELYHATAHLWSSLLSQHSEMHASKVLTFPELGLCFPTSAPLLLPFLLPRMPPSPSPSLFPPCACMLSCDRLCDPVDCSLLGSFVHRISQARILEWVAVSFSSMKPCFLSLLYNFHLSMYTH